MEYANTARYAAAAEHEPNTTQETSSNPIPHALTFHKRFASNKAEVLIAQTITFHENLIEKPLDKAYSKLIDRFHRIV